jgi:hypothetical protein
MLGRRALPFRRSTLVTGNHYGYETAPQVER